jgi:thymidine kinase
MATQKKGSIHIIKGPMFGGKTTELQRRFKIQRLAISKKKDAAPILLIRYAKDLRYSSDGLATHDRIVVKDAGDVVPASDLEEVKELAQYCSHIYIDEGQFFKNLKEHCVAWARAGKIVTIACLDAYGNHPGHDVWPEIARLEPWAIENVKYPAVCFKCGDPAPLTLTLDGSNTPTTKIGGSEVYEACCITCCDEESVKE